MAERRNGTATISWETLRISKVENRGVWNRNGKAWRSDAITATAMHGNGTLWKSGESKSRESQWQSNAVDRMDSNRYGSAGHCLEWQRSGFAWCSAAWV